MALLVFDTICLLACAFFLYVLLQWRREDKAAFHFARGKNSTWRFRNVRPKEVSFRREANQVQKRASSQAR